MGYQSIHWMTAMPYTHAGFVSAAVEITASDIKVELPRTLKPNFALQNDAFRKQSNY